MLDDGICMGVRTFVEKFRVLSIEHRKRRGTVPVARSIPVAAVHFNSRKFADRCAASRAHRHDREALWERVEAGSGSLGAASSESAAGSGRLRACGCSCCCTCVGRGFGFRFRLSRGRAGVSLGLDACEVRLCPPCVRVCACVSRVCPGSPRCLFTGTELTESKPWWSPCFTQRLSPSLSAASRCAEFGIILSSSGWAHQLIALSFPT